MKGKGIFLWRLEQFENKEAILILLQEGNFQRVDIKVCSGAYIYARNNKPEIFDYLRSHGIEVYGYGFCYGYNAAGEGAIAAQAIDQFNLDGYILDVEGKFESYFDCVARAQQLMSALRVEKPDTPVALCTWPLFKNPSTGGRWHNSELAREFMRNCDIAMPMVYWGHRGSTAEDAVDWLTWARYQWNSITDRPFVPVGRAYLDGHERGKVELQIDAVAAFAEQVRYIRLPGESWWELGWVTRKRPDIWELLKTLPAWDLEPDPHPGEAANIRGEAEKLRLMAEELEWQAGRMDLIADRLE